VQNASVDDTGNTDWQVCNSQQQQQRDRADGKHSITDDHVYFTNTTVRVCSFNIQIFGVSKASKKYVMGVLKQLLAVYDLIVIQEIRDASNTAFWELVDLVNEWAALSGTHFSALKSERLGRTSSKEEYGYLFRSDIALNVSEYQYNDTKLDKYERAPFGVLMRVYDSAEFVLVNSHIKPTDAVSELDYFVFVYEDLVSEMGTHSMLLGGDLNADCSYVSQSSFEKIRLYNRSSEFDWYIGDDDDTTLATSSCAYDRFVAAGRELRDRVVFNSTFVVHFDRMYELNETTAKKVSDHYPIEIQLSMLRATNVSLPNATSFGTSPSPSSSSSYSSSYSPSASGSPTPSSSFFGSPSNSSIEEGGGEFSGAWISRPCFELVAILLAATATMLGI
jgi:endonuclease/exonuclease/phosphatase family metal-dependent hydrolase